MDMFTRAAAPAKPADANAVAAAAASAAQQGGAQKVGTDNTENQNSAPVKGGADGQAAASKEPANPMDKFNGMFDTKGSGDDKGPPRFNLDKTKLGEAASAQDFMQGVNPELITRATSGDVKALMEMMNEVGRNAYRASLDHGSQLTDRFVEARTGFDAGNLSKSVKSELTTHALGDTPNFQHPVVKKQLIQIAKQMEQQFPDAGPQEIAQMSKEYLTELAQQISGKAKDDGKGKTDKDGITNATDWDKWFDENQED